MTSKVEVGIGYKRMNKDDGKWKWIKRIDENIRKK